MHTDNGKSSAIDQVDPVTGDTKDLPSSSSSPVHAAPEVIGINDRAPDERTGENADEIQASQGGWFAYLRTRNFYLVLLLGQVLALCITATNTFSSLLAAQPFSIPAFQTLWNYILLTLVYGSYTIYRYGWKGWIKLMLKDGWKYIILAFLDVEGNYFTLINFWAIVMVVLISSIFLHVRYHPTQIIGILICIGGVGILFGSDHITQGSGFGGVTGGNQLKGDLFALVGATFYGMSNVAEEFLVSKRPLYEVVGQLGFWGMFIDGAMTGIFDRPSYRQSVWNDGKVGGYLTGYTLCLLLFYSGAPIMFRLASAAFFNISLLTGNFWGVVIGVKVFHERIHWMYPIAFVCIIGGLIVYFVGKSILGEALKPWLGKDQERGVNGLGTARRRVERGDELVV
ncbi:hypothetical protein HO173_002243 [Letharia columbiana]|uniref:DUF914-domain-containing protein n=1 Tax=Letharia columbiana TaxID=112416 RepID=A0A8H6G359_9LECA|nr:uncharacterized protein HO173_002243 [Letharia columbiana]KAF6239697.1 hypothetical protein HO173_002243 [Letharia columbiana]